jgi:hypothetical protein
MNQVTDYFKLGLKSKDVSFVNVNVFEDNRVFIDPSVIRIEAKNGDKWATLADNELIRFFNFILACLHDPKKHDDGKSALMEFHEPPETRLGMSAKGFHGSGAGPEIGEAIWDSLLSNPLCTVRVALLKRIEDIALFVGNVANDRISDLTSRIIIEVLIEYTHDQMKKHPKLGIQTTNHPIQVWDSKNHAWDTSTYNLPTVKKTGEPDSPLILVPKRLVHIGLRMTPEGFWSHGPITAVQEDETRTVRLPDGKLKDIKPDKKDLKARPELEHIRPTNIEQTLRIWERDNRDLIEGYRRYIDGTYEEITQAQLDSKIQDAS